MKKLSLSIVIFFIPLFTYAFGSFQFLDFSSLPQGISGQPYEKTINFVYSGDWVPSASLIGEHLPAGISLSDFYTGKNGVGSLKIKGTPQGSGVFKINILLTDNNGATLLKTVDLNVEDGSSPFVITSTLPDGLVNQEYSGEISVSYFGNEEPNTYYSGLPSGVFVSKDNFSGIGKGTIRLSLFGKPTRVGKYPVSFKVWNQKQNEVKSFSFNIEEPTKIMPLPIVKELKITSPSSDLNVVTKVKQEIVLKTKEKIVPQNEVIGISTNESAYSATASVVVSSPADVPSLETQKVEVIDSKKISFVQRLRTNIKGILLSLANRF